MRIINLYNVFKRALKIPGNHNSPCTSLIYLFEKFCFTGKCDIILSGTIKRGCAVNILDWVPFKFTFYNPCNFGK